ncbi:MAG: hypothetical protein ACI9H8_001777 [Lysobacterales bacterium]|jgi:hypothetical protein
MKSKFMVSISAVLFPAMLISSAVFAKSDLPEITEEGLHKVKDTELALVYAKEGVDLSVYDKVWLVETSVAFKKNWQRDQNRSYSHKVSANDMKRIKSDLAELFREVFAETLDEAGHELVSEPAEDVLIVRPAIVNLDVNAPDTRSVGRGYQFVESAGDMTLYVELYDSVTGDLLVKAMDRKADRRSSNFQWQTKASNRAAAKRALQQWADRLAAGLSEAQNTVTGTDEDE